MLSLTTPMTDFGELADTSLRSLPPVGLVVIFAILVCGLLMWAFGGRLVKPMYGFLFGVAGATAGLLVPAALGMEMSPYIGVAVGAVVGVFAGILLFRISMATALGTAGGVLALLLAAAVVWLNPNVANESGTPLSGDELFLADVPVTTDDEFMNAPGHDQALEFAFDSIFGTNEADAPSDNGEFDEDDEALDEAVEAAAALAKTAMERIHAFIVELSAEARAAWGELPENQRLVFGVAAVLGGLAGFLLGFAFPKKVAAIGSAFIGAGIWAPIAVKALRDFDAPGAASLPTTARAWLITWLIIAAIGLALQWTVLKPKADRSSRAE